MATDHKPLLSILGPKKGISSLALARLQLWAILLSTYSYDVEFKSTHHHGNANELSRLPLPAKVGPECSAEPSIFNISQIEALPVTATAVRKATRKDPILSKVFRHSRPGWPGQLPEAMKPFSNRKLTIEHGYLMWGMRVIIPRCLQEVMLKELHSQHPGISRMKAIARSHVWWPKLDQDIANLVKSCSACQSVRQAPPEAPLHPWSWPSRPWKQVHIDFVGPFQGKMYFPETCVATKMQRLSFNPGVDLGFAQGRLNLV